jgi:hypothetical protein
MTASRQLGRVHRALFHLAFAAAGVLALASPAFAQSPQEIKIARQTAGDALEAYNKGEFEKALGLFSQASAVYPSAQILRMIGYSELALEHWVKAVEALETALDAKLTPLSKDDRKDVQEQIAKAMAHVGTLTVTSKVPGSKLSLDGGDPRPLPLEKPLRVVEGVHKLTVTAPERLEAHGEVKVEPGKLAEAALDPPEKPKPKPPPPPPPPPPPKPTRKAWVPQQRVVGVAAAGAGVAFGAAALGTFIEAGHWRSVANENVAKHLAGYGSGCKKGDPLACSLAIKVINSQADTADKLRNVSLGLGITAGVLAATGVVFYVMAPKNTPAAPAPRPDSAPTDPPPPQASRGSETTVGCGSSGLGLFCTGAF